MGNCMTKSLQNPEVVENIKEEKSKAVALKLLLIGAGESGKSTIAKQVKLIHQGFSEADLMTNKGVISQNVITSIQTLVQGASQFGYSLSPEGRECALLIQNQEVEALTEPDVVEAIRHLWNKEDSIQKAWARASELHVIESTEYYLNNLDRIVAPGYIPTIDDILRARAKTTGILEISFQIDGRNYKLVDVGGQRSERRKWLHCFQDVTAIIFCVSMSEYDQMLFEDHTTRRTQESMKLFEEICNSKWFGDVDIVLFFNKYDLFKSKITKVDMSCAFPDYDGGLDVKNGTDFLINKYLSLNRNEDKKVFHFIVTATNTETIKSVLKEVAHSVISHALVELEAKQL